jgi:hypothetical protein
LRCSGVDPIVGYNNVALHQHGLSSRSDDSGLGQSWYAQLTDEKRTEYKQRQIIARQKKKAATQSIVNLDQGSQTPETSLRIS